MPQLLVREITPDVVAALKRRASANGRSAEAEHRAILKQTLTPPETDFWENADRLRAESKGLGLTDSTEIIREFRDAR